MLRLFPSFIAPTISKIIKKDEYDILKPQWILDCVEAFALLHPIQKYYFHATSTSKAREDFGDEDQPVVEDDNDKDEEEPDHSDIRPKRGSPIPSSKTLSSATADTETESEGEGEGEADKEDPEMTKWTKIGKGQEPSDETRRRLREIPDEGRDSDAEDSADDRRPTLGDVTESEESDAELDGWKKVRSEARERMAEGLSRRMVRRAINEYYPLLTSPRAKWMLILRKKSRLLIGIGFSSMM